MTQEELRERTKKFALRIIKLVAVLPKTREADVIGWQVLKSGTSVGANYREATRARSKPDFISKIGIVEQEVDETLYWLELLAESNIIDSAKMEGITAEAKELLAIFVSSGKTAKNRYIRDSQSEIKIMIRGIILSVLALAYLMAGIVAYPEKSDICESAKGKIVVSKKRITLIDISGNYVDSYDTKEEIKDYSIDPKGDFLFVILGKPGAIRGERLAAFSITAKRIKNLWIDKNRGYNPWKVIAKDIDGDSQIEVCVGVWKKARFHPIFDNRLFIYGWDGDQIFPMWLGSRLSSPFTDFNFCDVDGDGIEELVALEIQRDGLKRVMAYKWKGFGFEGFKILKKEIKDETLSKSLMEEE